MTSESSGGDNGPVLVVARDNNGVATLTLNRPKHYNALSTAMMTEMEAALADIRNDDSVRVVIIEGAGRGFCAGHDLQELRSGGKEFLDQVFQQCSRLMKSITQLPQPVIAKVHGIATAAGCQLVATCDLAVAAKGARFGTPGVNIGLFCSTPMVAISRNMPRKRAMEMLLLGETFDAEAAAQHGLINFAVPDEELDQASQDLAHRIVEKSGLTLSVGKEAFYRQIDMTRNMMARDAREGIDAFLEKRDPIWEHR
jgi:enoyl-CoA hydratase/carnithine racemase